MPPFYISLNMFWYAHMAQAQGMQFLLPHK